MTNQDLDLEKDARYKVANVEIMDFIDGVVQGLVDSAEGRCKHFKDSEELVAYLNTL